MMSSWDELVSHLISSLTQKLRQFQKSQQFVFPFLRETWTMKKKSGQPTHVHIYSISKNEHILLQCNDWWFRGNTAMILFTYPHFNRLLLQRRIVCRPGVRLMLRRSKGRGSGRRARSSRWVRLGPPTANSWPVELIIHRILRPITETLLPCWMSRVSGH